MNELLFERRYSRKVYDLGNGQRLLRAHAGHIHFRDEATGALADIDHTWVDRGTYWEMTRASYRMQVAKDFAAPALIRYTNRYEGANHSITYEPHSLVWATGRNLSDVRPFRTQQAVQGVVRGSTITWTNALGPGIDFEVGLRGSGFVKEVVIRRRNALEQPPTAQHRLVLLSRYDGPGLDLKDTQGRTWQKAGEFDDQSDDGFRIEEPTGKHSLIRPAYIVESDADETRHRCPVIWTQRNGAMWQAKVLPSKVLTSGVYPLRADTVTSYYAGAGDGWIETSAPSTWASARADTTGVSADAIGTTCRVMTGLFASGWQIRRVFLPFDTSGIPDTDTISAAVLYAKPSNTANNDDNDGNDYLGVIGTSQASNTTLSNSDIDNVSDTLLSDDTRDLSSAFSTSAYTSWTLNATGLAAISKTGFTLLGLREGHDILNDTPSFTTNQSNQIRFHTSEATGTSNDPYLEVTYAAAGVSGVLASTLDAATLSATGTLALTGTLTATLDAATSSAAGKVALAGTTTATLADATLAATGVNTTRGTLSATLDDATASAAATLALKGTAAPTLADATLAATGTLALTGVLTATLDAATAVATGAVALKGTTTATLDDATLVATGTLAVTGSGSVTATLDDATLSAAGAVRLAGTLSATLDAATASSTGALALKGTTTATLDDATVVATGVLATQGSGTLAATLADATLVAAGTLRIAGVLASTLDNATSTATGTLPLVGATTATLDDATLVATGVVSGAVTGSLGVTLDDATLSATGHNANPLNRPARPRTAAPYSLVAAMRGLIGSTTRLQSTFTFTRQSQTATPAPLPQALPAPAVARVPAQAGTPVSFIWTGRIETSAALLTRMGFRKATAPVFRPQPPTVAAPVITLPTPPPAQPVPAVHPTVTQTQAPPPVQTQTQTQLDVALAPTTATVFTLAAGVLVPQTYLQSSWEFTPSDSTVPPDALIAVLLAALLEAED